jgi:putative sterol carrier protein
MIEAVLEQFNKQAANAAPIGGTIKFLLDEMPIFIDGTGDANVVTAEDCEADCTITTSIETLEKLRSGDLNPMMAVMGGKVKIKGDMGLAMKLQSLLG